jgi:hypothetical protein
LRYEKGICGIEDLMILHYDVIEKEMMINGQSRQVRLVVKRQQQEDQGMC